MSTLFDEQLEEIQTICKAIRLSGINACISDELSQAKEKGLSYEEFLLNILRYEQDRQNENGRQKRIRNASFPKKMYLEELNQTYLSSDVQRKLSLLSSLEFIKNGQNVILLGSTGTGKTHTATALGIKACMEGYKVLFTTVPLLITQLKECRSNKTLKAFENKFEKYDLVIADELGYISFDKEGAELLFTHISLRAGRKSTIITTNLSFDRWHEIFGDQVLTAAMIDRLTHKSYILDMSTSSYRIHETEKWLQNEMQK